MMNDWEFWDITWQGPFLFVSGKMSVKAIFVIDIIGITDNKIMSPDTPDIKSVFAVQLSMGEQPANSGCWWTPPILTDGVQWWAQADVGGLALTTEDQKLLGEMIGEWLGHEQ